MSIGKWLHRAVFVVVFTLLLVPLTTIAQEEDEREIILFFGVTEQNQSQIASIVLLDPVTGEVHRIDVSDKSILVDALGVSATSGHVLTTLSTATGADARFHIVAVKPDGSIDILIPTDRENTMAFITNNANSGDRFIYAQQIGVGLPTPYDLYLYDGTTGESRRINNDFVAPIVSVGSLDWSPDETQVVFTALSTDNMPDLYKADLTTGEIHRLTDTLDEEFSPIFAPDSEEILYSVQQDGRWRIHLMDADGANIREVVAYTGDSAVNGQWLPDGSGFIYERIIASVEGENIQSALHFYDLETGEDRVLAEHATIFEFAISPDGSQVAYMNNTFDTTPAAVCILTIRAPNDAWCAETIPLQATPIIWAVSPTG